MTTLLISAGDASGDTHAAAFVRALRASRPECRFFGLGGREMRKAGVELVADQENLAVGGLFEVFGSVLGLLRAWRQMKAALCDVDPNLVVLVDSGGFNLPFARYVRRHCSAPILYYVAPQVWAWRRGRLRKLAARVDRVALIFPFESAAYADTPLRVDFVGHPLVEALGDVARCLERGRARELLKLPGSGRLVGLLPGSRRNEIRHHLPIQLETARVLHERDPSVGFVLALVPSIRADQISGLVQAAALPTTLCLSQVTGRTHEVIRAADVILTKPGTATVEIMLLERPMVVMGRANAITAAILRRVLHIPWLGMPNLIAGEQVVPEFLQEDARPAAMSEAVLELFEGSGREEQLARLAAAKLRLGSGGAARSVSRIAEEMIGPDPS